MANADELAPTARSSRPAARRLPALRPRCSASACRPSAPTPVQALSFTPAFPCHSSLLRARKFGLTQLRNLAKLPTTRAILIAAPLPIVSGSRSPARILALVARYRV